MISTIFKNFLLKYNNTEKHTNHTRTVQRIFSMNSNKQPVEESEHYIFLNFIGHPIISTH